MPVPKLTSGNAARNELAVVNLMGNGMTGWSNVWAGHSPSNERQSKGKTGETHVMTRMMASAISRRILMTSHTFHIDEK
jgi:hypothetical protein